jgi:hypothetical protein
MATVEERLASMEARMARVDDIFALIGELRADMTRQLGEVRADMTRQLGEVRADMTRQLGEVRDEIKVVRGDINAIRTEAHRDFRWVVGIQLTTMAAVLAALVGAYYR